MLINPDILLIRLLFDFLALMQKSVKIRQAFID